MDDCMNEIAEVKSKKMASRRREKEMEENWRMYSLFFTLWTLRNAVSFDLEPRIWMSRRTNSDLCILVSIYKYPVNRSGLYTVR